MLWSFTGYIAGLGTTSGLRIVIGHWTASPFGAFSDVMLETASGMRVLLAPDEQVADFVAATYRFDAVVVGPVAVRVVDDQWDVTAPDLDLHVEVGGRRTLGLLLRTVPTRVRDSLWWARAIDLLARTLQPGVRTYGSAGSDRTEWYAASDVRSVSAAWGTFRGDPVGTIAPVVPPVRFGFGSAPRSPSLTTVRSFVRSAG
ncbi:hypothetical protein EHW97_12515 [Aeromicrobium camelliae]|uniref:Uncharacterized protein n=1 Tax=Aeromicrobium camelliae TaxID=1538144 RepID=A0A3N6WMY4_9ACTN|nr:hypothetical protein [Aeromicrobium camelliae]RQN02703.1 hypothetical protein EHW97_12515 [Aeromicrobium camelliae]